jgi:hypothetical protein
MPRRVGPVLALVVAFLCPAAASAQDAVVAGIVRDQTGDVLPGVVVELTAAAAPAIRGRTDAHGAYRIEGAPAGRAALSFSLVNFGVARRDLDVPAAGLLRADATLHLSLHADVSVTGKSTFTNLADVARRRTSSASRSRRARARSPRGSWTRGR